MRCRSIGWIMMGAWIGGWTIGAHASYLSDAQAALKKGDLKVAQINLRNAVRSDPQNAEAHFWLGRVALELGDPVAAEREAVAARERGFDPHQTVPLLSQALLTQNKFNELLQKLRPEGNDPLLDASILVFRGYAEVALKRPDDAQKSFAQAEQAAPRTVEPLLADARLLVARGNLAEAQAKIDQALAAQPKSADALLAKAQLLRLRNDTVGALALLDGLVADQPSVMQARLERASLELAVNKNDAAKADVDAVLKATPGNVQAIYLQAVMEAQARDYPAADADLERISGYIGRLQRGFYLQAVVKEQLGQTEQAEQAARKYLGRSPDDLAAYKVLARIQFSKHRPDQVIETLSKETDSGKADAEAYDLIGQAYAATGRGQEAIGAFQKAEALAPTDVGVQTRLASVRMGMGDADSAMGDLEHTLELAPKLSAVGEALFFAALATGDTGKAAEALAKIRAAQGSTEVVDNLEGLFKLAQIDFAGAKSAFTDIVGKHPDFIPARINLARVDMMLGDRPEAQRILTEVLNRQPVAEPALTMMVSSDVQANQLAEATALLERAHKADPARTRVTLSLGELYIRAGSPRKALDLAAAESPEASGTEILSLQATAYLALGQKKEARLADAEILKRDPNAVVARRQLVALLMEAGEFESARNATNAGIAANPRSYQLYQDLVMIDLKAAGVDAAVATADRLQAQDRDFPAIKALKGDIYMAASRPADAVTAYAEANNAAPSSLLVIRLSGALLKSGHAEDANALLADWLGKHGDDILVTEQASQVGIATGHYDEAAEYLERLLRQKPHDPVALNNLAWVCQQQGNDQKAQVLARQAYVLAPNQQTADTLGWILTTSGNARSGVALLRQATGEAAAADPRVLFHYAVALKDVGNRDEAKKNLETVVANQKDFKEKAEARKLLDDLSKGT